MISVAPWPNRRETASSMKPCARSVPRGLPPHHLMRWLRSSGSGSRRSFITSHPSRRCLKPSSMPQRSILRTSLSQRHHAGWSGSTRSRRLSGESSGWRSPNPSCWAWSVRSPGRDRCRQTGLRRRSRPSSVGPVSSCNARWTPATCGTPTLRCCCCRCIRPLSGSRPSLRCSELWASHRHFAARSPAAKSSPAFCVPRWNRRRERGSIRFREEVSLPQRSVRVWRLFRSCRASASCTSSSMSDG